LVVGDPEIRSHFGWCAAYVPNILIAHRNALLDSTLMHFWSLAIEEQFYLTWPAIVLFVPIRTLP
jgi:peptidoglycan/LPS O-acetylase OafA/YrhL